VNPITGATAATGSTEPGEQDADREAEGWLRGPPAINHALLSLAVRDKYALKPKKTAKKPKKTAKKPKIAETQNPEFSINDAEPMAIDESAV
jgi:hypothetical protein